MLIISSSKCPRYKYSTLVIYLIIPSNFHGIFISLYGTRFSCIINNNNNLFPGVLPGVIPTMGMPTVPGVIPPIGTVVPTVVPTIGGVVPPVGVLPTVAGIPPPGMAIPPATAAISIPPLPSLPPMPIMTTAQNNIPQVTYQVKKVPCDENRRFLIHFHAGETYCIVL